MESAVTAQANLLANIRAHRGGRCGKRLLLIGHMDTVFEPEARFRRTGCTGTSGNVVSGLA
jgi:glutamate carboxypeptidase